MFWTETWKLTASLWANGLALQEAVLASHDVIKHRSKTIGEALRDPLQADLPELNRMVPEKLAAFGEAGASLMEDWMSIQGDMITQGRELAALALSGRLPSGAIMTRLGRRASRITGKMGSAGGKAFAPLHATAMANRRRLKKKP